MGKEESQPPKAKRGKKGKKNKGKNKKYVQNEDEWNSDQEPPQKSKKPKKGKKEKKLPRPQQLLALKEQRQQALLDCGTDLVGNMEIEYAEYYDEEMKELWESQLIEYVSFYEEDYEQT